MTTAAARGHGLPRLSDLTTWLDVGIVAVTGVLAGLAAPVTHTSPSPTPGRSRRALPACRARPPGVRHHPGADGERRALPRSVGDVMTALGVRVAFPALGTVHPDDAKPTRSGGIKIV